MKTTLLAVAATTLALVAVADEESPADLATPLMGTDNARELSAGNLYPAIGRPWGMNYWTPQTGRMGNG